MQEEKDKNPFLWLTNVKHEKTDARQGVVGTRVKCIKVKDHFVDQRLNNG